MEAGVPVTPVYSADTTFVPNSNILTVSEYLHVRWNKEVETDISACVGWGCDKRLDINTLGVGYIRYLCSHHCCRCCSEYATAAAVKLAEYATPPLPPTTTVTSTLLNKTSGTRSRCTRVSE